MQPAVRLVVLNYNGGELVLRSLEAITKLDWPADRLEVVVVDNASSDRSPRRIEARFPSVRLLHSAVNTGFPGNNFGMDDNDDVAYVGLVNPDAFVEPDWLTHLVAALESDESLGAVCPRMLLEPRFVDLEITAPTHRARGDDRDLGVRICGLRVAGDERISAIATVEGVWGNEGGGGSNAFHWATGRAVVGIPVRPDGPLPAEVDIALSGGERKTAIVGGVEVELDDGVRWVTVPVSGLPYDVVNNAGSCLIEGGWGADRGLGQRDGAEFDEPRDVFAWCGGGVLMRSEYLRDVGLFDEDFFLYYEDTDLSWRGRGRGWRYRYVPEARMRHMHAASTVEGSDLFVHCVERNRLLMLTKNAPASFAFRAYVLHLKSTLGIARGQIVGPLTRGRRPDVTTTRRRLKAWAAAVASLPRTLPKRRQIRAGMTVSDDELLGWQVPHA